MMVTFFHCTDTGCCANALELMVRPSNKQRFNYLNWDNDTKHMIRICAGIYECLAGSFRGINIRVERGRRWEGEK